MTKRRKWNGELLIHSRDSLLLLKLDFFSLGKVSFPLHKKVYSTFFDGIISWPLTNGLQSDKGGKTKKPQYFVA